MKEIPRHLTIRTEFRSARLEHRAKRMANGQYIVIELTKGMGAGGLYINVRFAWKFDNIVEKGSFFVYEKEVRGMDKEQVVERVHRKIRDDVAEKLWAAAPFPFEVEVATELIDGKPHWYAQESVLRKGGGGG